MKKFIVFIIGLFLGLIIFMPKENIYFTLQKYLSKKNIYINSNINSFFDLSLKDGIVYYNRMDIMTFKKIDVLSFIIFNKIDVNNLKINFGNLEIKKANIYYSIITPFKIYIKGISNFGHIDGNIDLIKRKMKIYILNLNNQFLKNILQKDKKGYFYYATF